MRCFVLHWNCRHCSTTGAFTWVVMVSLRCPIVVPASLSCRYIRLTCGLRVRLHAYLHVFASTDAPLREEIPSQRSRMPAGVKTNP